MLSITNCFFGCSVIFSLKNAHFLFPIFMMQVITSSNFSPDGIMVCKCMFVYQISVFLFSVCSRQKDGEMGSHRPVITLVQFWGAELKAGVCPGRAHGRWCSIKTLWASDSRCGTLLYILPSRPCTQALR